MEPEREASARRTALDARIDAAVSPLRFWITYGGWGSRGQRAQRHLDDLVAELKGTRPDCDYCGPCATHKRGRDGASS